MKIVDENQNTTLRAAVPVWLMEQERSFAWLARKVGVSRSLIALWIKEESNISKPILDKIEEIIKI